MVEPLIQATPEITSGNLSSYLAGLAHDYDCEVDAPTVEGEAAVYVIHASNHERFADMTGTYQLLLRWDAQSGEWNTDMEESGWQETEFSLNLNEFYDESYFWAAYPVVNTTADPMYFQITDMTQESCTISWWAGEYEDTVINGAYEGTAQVQLVMEYSDGELQHPRWRLDGVQLDTALGKLAGGSNLVNYFLEISPTDFFIAPSDDTAKYAGVNFIQLQRIS